MHTMAKVLITTLALIAGMLAVGLPARAADSTVSGNVSSSRGPVDSGSVYFYASCQDYYDDQSAAWDAFDGGAYSVSVPDGTYRVQISPDNRPEAVTSWHNAKPGCAQADVVTVSGGSVVVDLVAATGSHVTGGVTTEKGSVSRGALSFFTSCEEYYAQIDWPGTFTGGTYSTYLPDGTYRVLFYHSTEDDSSVAYKSFHAAKPSCSQADVVTVSGDTVLDIRVAYGVTVNGTVSTRNGPVGTGDVFFYASCQDVVPRDYRGWSAVVGGAYSSTVIPGTYRVLITPSWLGALESWHNAKPSCDAADTVVITGDTNVNLVAQAVASATPSPSPTPTTTTAAKQTVKKPPARLKKGQRAKLAKKTQQGSRLTWKSRTKAICSIDKTTLKAKKKGACTVKAKAAALPGFSAYTRTFTIRVK